MSFGRNLQYLRRMGSGMTQEALADRMNVSRQTVSKWEMDTAIPEIDKAIALCDIFRVTLDDLFRKDLAACDGNLSDLRVETVPAFRYIAYTVISCDPEGDALNHIGSLAKENGCAHPKLIGWDFPDVSAGQINVHHMHGYTAAWVLSEEDRPENARIVEQPEHRYAAIHIARPFEDPFNTIPQAYRTLMDWMREKGLNHTEKDVIPCFETDGETMDVYIACE